MNLSSAKRIFEIEYQCMQHVHLGWAYFEYTKLVRFFEYGMKEYALLFQERVYMYELCWEAKQSCRFHLMISLTHLSWLSNRHLKK